MTKRHIAVFLICMIVLTAVSQGCGGKDDNAIKTESNNAEEASEADENISSEEASDVLNDTDAENKPTSELDLIMKGVYEGGEQHEQTVYDCADTNEYVEAAMTVNAQKVWSDVERITIDTKNGTVNDQDGDSVTDLDPLIGYIEKNKPDDASALLKESGYEILGRDDGMITVNNVFRTKTLIIRSDDTFTDDLALFLIHDLQHSYHEAYYDTVKETAISYRSLLNEGYNVMPSQVIEADDPAS